MIALDPRSPDELLAASHTALARVRILDQGRDTGTLLPCTGGSVTIDETNPVRRSGTLTVAGLTAWVPRVATDPLNPASGVELVPERAWVDDTSVTRWTPLGVFRPHAPDVTDDGALAITCQVVDRADAVRRALILDRFVFPPGSDVAANLRRVLAAQAPWLPLDIPDSGVRLTSEAVVGSPGADPWEECQAMARTLGADLRVDADGTARLHPITGPLVAPVSASWVEDGALLALKRSGSADDLVNGIVVVWGMGHVTTVWDDTSSYGTGSPIGRRPAVYSGDATTIGSDAQAQAAGMAELITRQGLAQRTTCTVVADPRRDAGDAVRVTRQRLGVDEVLRITSLTIPLVGPSMDVDFGARRVLT